MEYRPREEVIGPPSISLADKGPAPARAGPGQLPRAVGAVASAAFLALLLYCLCRCCLRRRAKASASSAVVVNTPPPPPIIIYVPPLPPSPPSLPPLPPPPRLPLHPCNLGLGLPMQWAAYNGDEERARHFFPPAK
jgi:hypothetical protein